MDRLNYKITESKNNKVKETKEQSERVKRKEGELVELRNKITEAKLAL